MSNLMDFLSGLMAASSAGKMPSTKQANAMADWLLNSPLIQLESGAGGKLSAQGTDIVRDLRALVQAYQAAAAEKNGDDTLQDALFELSQSQTQADAGGAKDEAKDFAGAVRLMFSTALSHFAQGDEWASLARLTVADVAEVIEGQAGAAKEHLRGTEQDVQDGTRDAMGRSVGEKPTAGDGARAKFEKRMEAVKNVGGQAIGARQDIKDESRRVADNASQRFDDAAYNIAERAQNDPEYRRAVDTCFSLYHKYMERALDRAKGVEEGGVQDFERQMADIMQDPRVAVAMGKLRVLVERFAGGKSLDNLLAAAGACATDIREDGDVRAWFDEAEVFVRRSIDEPGFLRSEERTKLRENLQERWRELKSSDTDAGRKWAADLQVLEKECEVFSDAVARDGSLQRLKDAHLALGKHIASEMSLTGKVGSMMGDMTEVVLPRLFSMLKEIPLPRTEFIDDGTEVVLENMTFESLNLLPGHVTITNTTSVNIDAPSVGQTQRNVSTRTRIQFTGVQMQLKQVSFFFHDKSLPAVKTVTGLMDVTIPEKGVNMDLTLVLLPTATGTEERRKRHAFHRVEDVKVHLDGVKIGIKESNHQVLLSMLKPVMRARLTKVLSETLEQYTRITMEALDGMAYDVHTRAQVFADAGAPMVPAYISGLFSFFGRPTEGKSALADVTTTNVGVVKELEGKNKAFAIGAGPQLVSGEKHGPVATSSRAAMTATDAKNKAALAAPAPQIEGFAEALARKRDAEQAVSNWRSSAYDLPVYAQLNMKV
ncbi:hypothetical protein AURDEDRAFT_151311 [Auricularia subglabra TFB-10046 SS5]|nr:hypothetical protein AURDEDRAFT_151311 [Auricularia subglabra TFB-10046 SS5]